MWWTGEKKVIAEMIRQEQFGFLDKKHGGLAQLARALDLHSRGHRFDSDILHDRRFADEQDWIGTGS